MSKFSEFGNALYSGDRSFNFTGRRKVWYTISLVVIAISAILPFTLHNGYNFGIEFKGGSEFTISGGANKGTEVARTVLDAALPGKEIVVSTVGTDTVRVQTPQLSDTKSEEVRQALAKSYSVESAAVSSSFIGASWGTDVTGKAVNGLLWFLALAAILMAIYFRTVKMSVAAMSALLHDLLITAGIYGALGLEVTPAAVIGFLTILGYSLYDTVVVFDKIRENTEDVEHSETATFSERVNLAINQTLVRSINTTVVAILPVASILFIGAIVFGAGTLRDISLALFIGMLVGTYSTIFVAAPFYSQLREKEPKFANAAAKVLAKRG
jgi:preprotein translocase subunit SecF